MLSLGFTGSVIKWDCLWFYLDSSACSGCLICLKMKDSHNNLTIRYEGGLTLGYNLVCKVEMLKTKACGQYKCSYIVGLREFGGDPNCNVIVIRCFGVIVDEPPWLYLLTYNDHLAVLSVLGRHKLGSSRQLAAAMAVCNAVLQILHGGSVIRTRPLNYWLGMSRDLSILTPGIVAGLCFTAW